ncbi:hypothetical protein AMTRI_Chr03g49850 [Amborella trichopoda]
MDPYLNSIGLWDSSKSSLEMPHRAFVVIVLFWALLTLLTPTLIYLSASAKPTLDSPGEERGQVNSRKMMGIRERSHLSPEAPAPTPALAPQPQLISSTGRTQIISQFPMKENGFG